MMSGPRYDADQTTTAHLKDTVGLDAVRDEPASVVHRVLEPAHLSVWISGTTKTASAGRAAIAQFSHRLAERHRTQADSLDSGVPQVVPADSVTHACTAAGGME